MIANGPRDRHSARRSHSKVRTGCKKCKSRRVKCDEGRPSCNNCIHQGVECDFSQNPDAREIVPIRQTTRTLSCVGTPQTTPRQTDVRHAIDVSLPIPFPGLNLPDLELMYHWTSSTSMTLTQDPQVHGFWRHNLVTVGLGCDFVMRSILSLSALHLSHLCPERRPELLEKSIAYQEFASTQAVAAMASIHGDEKSDLADSVFCYSLLTMYIVLSGTNSSDPQGALFSTAPGPDWLRTFGGVRELGLRSGPGRHPAKTISPIGLFAVRRFKLGERAKAISHPLLDHLRSRLGSVDIDPAVRSACKRAVDELYAPFAIFHCALPEGELPDIMDLFLWLTKVMPDFVPLLQQGSQEALAVFSYFCMLPGILPRQWWLGGWAESLRADTHRLLNAEHREWVVEPPAKKSHGDASR